MPSPTTRARRRRRRRRHRLFLVIGLVGWFLFWLVLLLNVIS